MLSCDHDTVLQEFSPGSSGKMSTMGAYVRDLLLGQVCLDLKYSYFNIWLMNLGPFPFHGSSFSFFYDLFTDFSSSPCSVIGLFTFSFCFDVYIFYFFFF